jgi:N-formylglutamate amidohydrolase
MRDPWLLLEPGEGPIVATAIHDGHAMRPELIPFLAIDEATRLREEDPFTGELARAAAPTRVIATHSRFEFDLNRTREQAVYRTRQDAFGLDVWKRALPAGVLERSLAGWDACYRALRELLSERERRYGRFVVLDIHSYNHRRAGENEAPDDPITSPEVNVGTGTLDRSRWRALVERFSAELSGGGALDVRENVRFRGGAMSAWIHRTFPTTGCALALEFKKTYMDEWSGAVSHDALAALGKALASTLPGLIESLGG